MRKFYLSFFRVKFLGVILVILGLFINKSYAQQLTISDFVIFGGNPSCPGAGQTPCNSPGCAVQIGSSSVINGGSVGSFKLVKSTGNLLVNGNIYSGGTIQLANGNTVTGKITAANLQQLSLPTTILSVGSSASLGGNIDVNGKIIVGGGTVSGKVTHPTGTTYSGPNPAGGNVTGTPTLPTLPQMPAITNFPACGSVDITSSQTITPGYYRKIKLSGNKTITLSGPGVYVFKSIENSGNTNNFVFDFQNNSTGDFLIYIHGDVDLNKVKASMINGGSATRIYSETHGNGDYNSDHSIAWQIENGSSGANTTKWLGSVWAPYAAINIGSGSGSAELTGAFWSGTQVNVGNNVTLNYAPYSFCTTPNADAGPDKPLDFLTNTTTLTGTSTTPGVSFSWQAINGGVITTPANTATITVSAAGKYVLTVIKNSNCYNTDTVTVTSKVNNLIGSELKSLHDNFTPNAPPSPFFVIRHDSVMIEVIARENKYAEVLALLQTTPYGLTNIVPNGGSNFIITGKFPIAKLLKLDSLPTLINYCRPLFQPVGGVGITTTQGDIALRTDFLRNGFGLNGDSTKVGVLSDSYNTLPGDPAAVDVANKDLPGVGNPNNSVPVEIVQEYPFGIRSDEGRAMLQIVHDIAPKAKLAFRTGFISAGDMADGIRQLKQQSNCDIIVDDVTFITEPFFQDGVISQAVNQVSAQGVAYFTSAGNFANKSYEATFTPAAMPNGLAGSAHNFGGGDIYQGVTLAPGAYTIVLQWEDPIYSLGQTQTGTQNDLDIYLTDNNGVTLFGFNRNNLGGDPLEVLPFNLTTATTTNILISRLTGTGTVRFKYVIFRGNATINEYTTGNSTIVGQGNADSAFTIGAVRYTKTPAFGVTVPELETFSSWGGTTVNNAVRNKPDFTAPQGGNTSVQFNPAQDIDGDGHANFFGTSAAAPHAAAVAALIKQARKRYYGQDYSNADLRRLLKSSALDMNESGFDFKSGNGLIRADVAIQEFASATPSLIRLVVPDNVTAGTQPFTITVKGNYLSDETKIIFRTDTLPSTFVNDSTITANVPVFIGNPPFQAYTKPLTPVASDGGISNTITLADVVKKNIKIKADNKSMKYGEIVPAFTSTITVDNVPLSNTTLTLADVGLENITYSTPATSTSNVNKYIITPSRPFNLTNPIDIGLNEIYTYTFEEGFVDVLKMPLKVTPLDKTIVYGDQLGDITFNYEFDQTHVQDAAAMLNTIKAYHEAFLPENALAVIKDGSTLSAADLLNMSTMASFNAIKNSRKFDLLNNRLVPAANPNAFNLQYLVDVSAQSILNYNIDSANSSFIGTYPGINARAMLSANALANNTGKISVNGSLVQMVNGSLVQMVNGETGSIAPIVNGSLVQIVNGSLVQLVNGVYVPIPNGSLVQMVNGSLVQLVNGSLVQLVNGSLVQMVNGSLVQMVNGSLVQLVNGVQTPIINGSLVQLVNGSLVQMVNGVAVPIPNGSLVQMVNGSLVQMVNGSLVQMVNGSLVQLVNGSLVQMVNGSLVQMVNGNVLGSGISNNNTAVIIDEADVDMQTNWIGPMMGINMITGLNAGEQKLVPGVLVNANFDISYGLGNVNILPTAITIKAKDTAKVYGEGLTFNPKTFTITSGEMMPGESIQSVTLTSTGAPASAAAGNYPVIPSAAAGSEGTNINNYAISYENGNLAVAKAQLNITADNASKIYGAANPSFTASYSGFVNGQTFATSGITGSPDITTTATVASPVGTYPISVSQGTLSSANYSFNFINGSSLLTIGKASVLVTANNANKTYGSSNPGFTASYSGFVNGQTLATSGITGSPAISTAAIAASPVGNYPITIAQGSLLSSNYNFSFQNGVLSIGKATLVVKPNNATKVYGSANPVFTASYSGFVNGQTFATSGITGSPEITTTATAASPVGSYPLSITQGTLSSANYDFSFQNNSCLLTITKAPLIVKANNASRAYGDPNPAFTATYIGLVNGQTFATSGITGSPGLTTSATVSSNVGNYTITISLGTLASSNYSFSCQNGNGTLTITKAPLNIKANDKVIFKGDATPTFTSVVTGLKNGDNVSVVYNLSPSCSWAPGMYSIIPSIGYCTNVNNYAVTFTNGTLYINPKGNGAKKLKPYLACVEEVINPSSPNVRYIAHFYCINENSTPVYVSVGTDNKLSSSGSFDATGQPVLFMPGRTDFEVPFSGTSLKWELRTYEGNSKVLMTVTASSSSPSCNYTTRTTAGQTGIEGKEEKEPAGIKLNEGTERKLLKDKKETSWSSANVYPNPASASVTVHLPNEVIIQKGISLTDMSGKSYPVKIVRSISEHAVELDISGLSAGLYLIKVKTTVDYKVFRVLKVK